MRQRGEWNAEYSRQYLTFVSPYYNIYVSPKERGNKMSPRTGRPTDNPKKHETRIRMSEEDVNILEYCCKVTGKSKSDVIRDGIREVYAKIKK